MLRELQKAKALKARLRSGKPCLGAQVALRDPAIVEILGRAGFDWLLIDTEHSAIDDATVCAMLQAGAANEAVVLVRPLRLETRLIGRYLDLGSAGVLCPFINSADDARQLVQACKYPPLGLRGCGPRRAANYGFDTQEYFQAANDATLCLAIIETREAVANIDAITEVQGLDGVTLGPLDLSISLGAFGDFDRADYQRAVQTVREACQRHGTAMGTGCYSLEHAQACYRAGDVLLLIGGDDLFLRTQAQNALSITTGKLA